jgi:hypothetical protein
MYMINTRSDICFVVNTLNQYMVEPRHVHWIETCYTSKLLTSMMTYCRHYKCRILAISVASVTNIILSSFLCRVSNDITGTLKTPSKTGLRRRNHLTKSTKLLP